MLSVNPCSNVSFGYSPSASSLNDPVVLAKLQEKAKNFVYKDINMDAVIHAVAPKTQDGMPAITRVVAGKLSPDDPALKIFG